MAESQKRPRQRGRQAADPETAASGATPPEPTPQRGSEAGSRTRRPDPDGPAWHEAARASWEAAVATAASAEELAEHVAPALPEWTAPAFVKRELFGRYLVDRDTGLVHDVRFALESCELDGIVNATFYHFELELEHTADVGGVIDHECMSD